MDVLGSTGTVLLNLSRAQLNEQKDVKTLATGLRINAASDDPSGLAIAESLQTKIGGLQQASQNVQSANNLLTVADGAAANIQSILQRVKSLLVQSASDVNSRSDLQNIQVEINGLLQEINKISGSANFNGVKLFDGSHDTYVAGPFDTPTVREVNPGPNADGSIPSDQVYDGTGSGMPNPAAFIQNFREGNTQDVEGLFLFRVTGYSNNPTDPTTGPLGQPGVYIENDEYSTDPMFSAGLGDENKSVSAVPTGAGYDLGTGGSLAESTPGNAVGTLTSIAFDIANLSPQDVGVAAAFVVTNARQSGGGTAISVNDGGQEGSTVSISLPTLSASALDVSAITVLPPGMVDNNDNPVGQDGSNQYAVMDAQARVDNALQAISQVRGQIGAQSVALSQDANNAATDIVNQTASESAIRDANIGSAVTAFTRDQIVTKVTSSVLAQMQVSAKSLTRLLVKAL